jgi:hypothetical protein
MSILDHLHGGPVDQVRALRPGAHMLIMVYYGRLPVSGASNYQMSIVVNDG